MENVNKNSNQCSRCKNYNSYYTLGTNRFNKTKCGLCLQTGEVVEANGVCENFSRKLKFRRSTYSLKRMLNHLLAEITDIRQVLECEEID